MSLAHAADWLRAGGIVAYPTETFYGLAVDPTSADAVAALFDLKGRDPAMAMPLIAASREAVERACGALAGANARLADAFWPGPLTLVLDAPPQVTAAVHAGRRTIAVRVPGLDAARQLAATFGGLITSTSANRSGEPPVRAAGDLAWLAGDTRVLVIDGGETPGGAPSTIVDARATTPPVLVREGAIAWSRVLEFLQE